jgi:hypothetical protein
MMVAVWEGTHGPIAVPPLPFFRGPASVRGSWFNGLGEEEDK